MLILKHTDGMKYSHPFQNMPERKNIQVSRKEISLEIQNVPKTNRKETIKLDITAELITEISEGTAVLLHDSILMDVKYLNIPNGHGSFKLKYIGSPLSNCQIASLAPIGTLIKLFEEDFLEVFIAIAKKIFPFSVTKRLLLIDPNKSVSKYIVSAGLKIHSEMPYASTYLPGEERKMLMVDIQGITESHKELIKKYIKKN